MPVSSERSAGRRVCGAPLAPLTTLGLGGPARTLVTATGTGALVAAVAEADATGERLLLLGGGSNVVLADDGFDGRVLLIRTRGVDIRPVADGRTVLTVAAGEPWDGVVERALAAGLAGIECLSGIPGSAGAAPIQNIGAYGQELADSCREVHVWDRVAGRQVLLPAAGCGFAYRDSLFKRDERYVVLSITLELASSDQSAPVRYQQLADALSIPLGARAPLRLVRDTVLELRRGKGMVLDPADPDSRSVGSFFLNPVLSAAEFAALRARTGTTPPHWPAPGGRIKVSAAWLVETAGFTRGYGTRAVGVSGKHTLALVHRGGGTTAALLALADQIVRGVHVATGVTLHPEARIVPARPGREGSR